MPDDQTEVGDLDFAGEMQSLAYEAQAKTAISGPRYERKDKELLLALGQLVRPLAIELESIREATSDNGKLLTILNKTLKPAGASPVSGAPGPAHAPESMEQIVQQLQRLGAVETANQKLFDAMHAELKGYKDSFLFDALQRPFIRDLVSIFDDFVGMHTQLSKRIDALQTAAGPVAAAPKGPRGTDPANPIPPTEAEFLGMLAGNVDNQISHFLEVFLRMEVALSQSPPGTALDKKMHRTMAFEPAASAAENDLVVRSLKPGFTWRDRMIRPEEVVVSRWSGDLPPPPAPAPAPAPPPVSAEKDLLADFQSSRPARKPTPLARGID